MVYKHGGQERQLVTGGIFYCRDSSGFSVSASNKLSCNLIGQYFEIGNKNIPPNRWQQVYDDTQKLVYTQKINNLALCK